MHPLDAARLLAEAGVPIFLAKHSANNLGFALPAGWERTEADPAVVDGWKAGMAICAVTGHALDVIDVDPRNGGSIEALKEALGGELPTIYGVQKTPSGGEHYFIAPLGVRKVQSVVPGVDIQAGNSEGVGRGFVFLAPTLRESKATGEPTLYTWETPPNLGMLLLGDDSGEGLAALVEAHHGRGRGKVNQDGSYEGPHYSELGEIKKAEADETVAANLEHWRKLLADALDWPEHYTDSRGRGWEALAYQSAWALAKMAACPWMPLTEEEAEDAYHDMLPPAMADNPRCAGKWYDGIVEKAEAEPVDVPPWVERGDVEDDFGAVRRPVCNATNESQAAVWLEGEAGRGRLAGLFRRKDDLVYTPRIGEEGYVPPGSRYDDDGPGQIRRLTPLQLAKRVDARYRVVKVLKNGNNVDSFFPEEATRRSMADLDEMRNLNHLSMVTHTPIVRADGTILDTPGYDQASGVLYLPERDLHVPAVPDEPSAQDVDSAVKLLTSMVQDFPFKTDHDLANYMACLLIPLMRALAPPPYRMLIINAPQRGSGKSLLAQLMRMLHGGVFRSEMPREEPELKKVVTSILDGTSAPIVQFDNVSGRLRSPWLDGLLTATEITERRLGATENIHLPNDRLWVVTGNNIMIGGDLDRRVLWTTIDADMEQPELRPVTTFAIPNLEGWVIENRGELLRSLLILVRAWAVAGMPMEKAQTSDNFGSTTQKLQGILTYAGMPGTVGEKAAVPSLPDPEAEEWSVFLKAAEEMFGGEWWTAREMIDRFQQGGDFVNEDALPGDLADKVRHQAAGAVKSLGRMLAAHRDQLSGGRKVTSSGSSNRAMRWAVVNKNPEGAVG